MDYFLFFTYLILFPVLVWYLDKKNIISIDIKTATLAFFFKVAMACLYGYVFEKYYNGDDTWMYHYQSQDETAFLKRDPLHFLHSLIDPTSYTRYMMTTWWQELEYASLIKLLAILNVFSGGAYYVNAVLFSMLTFWGAYFYYRLFTSLYPNRKMLIILVCFFFVPLVFWTSGIRKDGLIFLYSGMLLYSTMIYFQQGNRKLLLVMALALLGLALNRNFVALSILPALFAWWTCRHTDQKPFKIFAVVYGLLVVIFFISTYTGPVDLPAKFVQRQADFMALSGGSYMHLDTLKNTPASFISILPQALEHVFLRPYPGESSRALYMFSAFETWFVVTFVLLALLFPAKRSKNRSDLMVVYVLLFFALTNYLFIGYTIPFLGAIVRYRVVYEAIILAVAVCSINWEKLLPQKLHNIFL